MSDKGHKLIGINVGSKLNRVEKLHATIKMILDSKDSDEATKQKALDVLQHVCSVNNVNISNNSVTQDKE